jgi:hypothetical protein
MIRTIVTPKKPTISFDIPLSYIGREIEVIAFAKDECEKSEQKKKKVSFTASTLDTRSYKFNRDEANER